MKLKPILTGLSLLLTSVAHASLWDELSPAQQRTLRAGGQATVVVEQPGSPIPTITTYQLGDFTPEEGLAVYADYDRAHEYVPDLEDSRIEKRLSPVQTWIAYVIKPPFPLKKEHYTTEDSLSRDAATGTYQSRWSLVRAETLKWLNGTARFEPVSGSRALIAYRQSLHPGDNGGGWMTEPAKKQVAATVEAFAKYVSREKAENLDLLQRQIEQLRKALASSKRTP